MQQLSFGGSKNSSMKHKNSYQIIPFISNLIPTHLKITPGKNNFLNDLKNSKSINDELANALTPNETKTAGFYLLPTIRGANNPGRPVISSINCNTTKLSKFFDYHIQPLAKKIKSNIQDTTGFINKLQELGPLPENAILATRDVRSLRTNISNEDGVIALKEALDNRYSYEPQSELMIKLVNHVLTLKNITFNGTNYLQINGCAMGAIASPSYATIFMGNFEERFI